MTRFEIPIPHRDRGQQLIDALHDARDAPLDEGERDLARVVMWEALLTEGEREVGETLDRLEAASPDERRAVLDRARATLGQPSVAEVECRRDLARARRGDIPPPPSRRAAGPPRDAQGRAWQRCANPDCAAVPMKDGVPAPVRAVRWWCPTHEDQAAPGDLEDWQAPALRFGRAGLEQDLTDEDRAYYRELDRKREQEQLERNRRRAEDAERIERLECDHRANLSRTPGF